MGIKISPKHIVLDLSQSRHIMIQASQYDVDSRELIIHVTNDGEFFAVPQNYQASIEYKKSDNTVGVVDCEILSDGTLSFTITEQMTAVAGHCKCDLMIVSNKNAINTSAFIINVKESVITGDEIKSKDDFTSLTRTVIKAKSAITTMAQMQENFSDYIEESTEKIDYCIEQAEKAQAIAEKNVEDAISSAEAAQASEDAAKASEDASKVSETNAKSSETKSKTSETNSKTSETNAKASENAAKTSEANAKTSETNAKTSENNANTYANAAQASKESAQTSANTATTKANEAKTSATNANASANLAAEKANEMVDYADQSKSYAIGTNDEYRAGDSTDNAKYYYEQTKNISLDITKSNGHECINSKPGGYRLLDLEGSTEQKVVAGNQLFDASKLPTTTMGGATVTNNGDGSFTVSGSGTLTEFFSVGYNIPKEDALKLLKVGTLYINEPVTTSPCVMFGIYDSNGALKFRVSNTTNNNEKHIEITQNILDDISNGSYHVDMYIYGSNGKTIVPGTIKPMVYQDGDGTWEPFVGHAPSPNPDFPQAIENTFDCVEMISGYYDIGNYTLGSGVAVCSKNKTPCKSGDTITLNLEKTHKLILVSFYKGGDYLSQVILNMTTSKKEYVFTAPSEAEHFNYYVQSTEKITPQTVGKITLTVNGKYVGQIVTSDDNGNQKVVTFFLDEPLCEGDRIVKVDGVWYAERVMKNISLKDIEDWTKIHNYYRYTIGSGKVIVNDVAWCTHFTENPNINSDNTETGFRVYYSSGNTASYLIIRPSNYADLTTSSFKAMLAENDVKLQYRSTTPTYETLDTASQLALNDMVTFDGVTYIEVDSKVKPTSISGEYGTSQVGAYTLKCMNDNDTDRVERAELRARLDEMAVMIVAMGSEV